MFDYIKRMFKVSGGFTLIEILIGILILSVALLGIAALTGTVIKGNKKSSERTYASLQNLAKYEYLKNIAGTNFDHADLTGSITPDFQLHTDYLYKTGVVVLNAQDPAIYYTRTWSITDDASPANVKTVVINVNWLTSNNVSLTTTISR